MPLVGLLAAAWVLGGLVTRRLDAPTIIARVTHRFAGGLCAVAIICLPLALFSLVYAQAALYVIGFGGLLWELARNTSGVTGEMSTPRGAWEWYCAFVVLLGLLLAFLSALAPVTGEEALTVHLALAKQHALDNHVAASPSLAASSYTNPSEAIYAIVHRGTSEKPAQILSVLYAALLCGALWSLCARLGGARAGWTAAAIGASAPVFVTLSHQPATSLLLCALAILACDAIAESRSSRSKAALLLVGLYAVAALLCAWLPTHDSANSAHGLLALLRYPWDLVMRPGEYDGWAYSAGPLALALGLPALLLGPAAARVLLLAAAAGGLVLFFFAPGGQPVLPFIALAWAAIALSLEAWRHARIPVHVAIAAVLAAGILLHAREALPKIPVILGRQNAAEYLESHIPRYAAYGYLNRNATLPGAVLCPEAGAALLTREAFTNPAALTKLLNQPTPSQLQWLADHEIRYIIHVPAYLKQNRAWTNLAPLFEGWAADTQHFRLMQRIYSPLPGGGTEAIDIYELLENS